MGGPAVAIHLYWGRGIRGDLTEYLDLLHAPQESGACIEVISRLLNTLGWDEVYLSDMSAQSPLLGLRGRLEKLDPESEGDHGGPMLSVRHLGRVRGVSGAIVAREPAAGPQAVAGGGAGRDDLRFGEGWRRRSRSISIRWSALHKQRWTAVGKTGSFAPRHAEFHRNMVHRLAPTGAVVLGRLALEGTPFAVVYGHRVGEKVYCYQQGVVPESKVLRSPGTAAWLLLMQCMAEQGVTLFDHQRGVTTFKERFATGEHPLAEIRIVKPTFRYLATRMGDLARRATAKAGATYPESLPRRTAPAGDGSGVPSSGPGTMIWFDALAPFGRPCRTGGSADHGPGRLIHLARSRATIDI